MESISFPAVCSFKEFESHQGEFITTVDHMVDSDKDIRVIDNNTGDTICILLKNVLPKDILETTVSSYLPIVKKMDSANRGFAAGMKTRIIKDKYERSNPVNSVIAGYIDSPNNKYPCRMTKFSKIHFDEYSKGIPLIEKMDELFKNTLPTHYAKQLEYALKTNFRINNTVFTTVTVNYNFQTAVHVDKGDCREGFGTLVVYSKGIEGGHLLFPRYNCGIVVKNGDMLFMNVHEYHCNSPIQIIETDGYRLSFVAYLRERLLKCIHNQVLEEIGIEVGKHWDTEVFIQKIIEKIHATMDKRIFSTESPKDWSITTETYELNCRKRQYNLYDKRNKKKVQSLYNIWNYLKEV